MLRGILLRCFAGLVGMFVVVSWLGAQDAPSKVVVLPDGTPIHLYLKDDLDSKSSREGDAIRFQVRQDVVVDNVVVIPAGSLAEGHMTAVGRRGMAGHSGRLSFSVDYVVTPDGTKVPVVSSPSLSGGSNGKVVAAATATYGPAALLMRGWNADLRKGTMLNAYVNGNHEIAITNPTVHPIYTSTVVNPAPATPPAPPLAHRPSPPVPAPRIVLVDPAVRESDEIVELTTPTITIRGEVTDPSGIPVVTINSEPTGLRPKGPQAASFTSDPIKLQAGDTAFEIVATDAERAQARITFVARYKPAIALTSRSVSGPDSNRLCKADILSLLQGGVGSARVTELIEQRGITFSPTDEDIKQIRASGGGNDLINGLRKAKAR
jgi:hypothetical protein